MAFVPAINVAAVGYVFQIDEQYVEMEQEVIQTDLSTTGLNAVAAVALGAFRDAILPFLSNDLKCMEVVVADVSTEFGPVVTLPFAAEDVGGIEFMALPNNCSLCVTKVTAARGRSAHGRFYIPGIPTNARRSPSHLSSTFMSDINGALVDFFAAFTAASFEPAIVSRVTSGADRVSGLVQVMTQYRIYDDTLDSQRRRLPGRGS